MATSLESVEKAQAKALHELDSIDSLEGLEHWRVSHLGRNSSLTQLLRGLQHLASGDRRAVGAAGNKAKGILEERLAFRESLLSNSSGSTDGPPIDVTLPGWPIPKSGLHPTTRMVREICNAFVAMGFQIAEGDLATRALSVCLSIEEQDRIARVVQELCAA